MKRNNILKVLTIIFILFISFIYFMNKRLVSEIKNAAEDNKNIKAVQTGKIVSKQIKDSKAVQDLENSMMDKKVSQFEKDFLETKDPIYEAPLENVILMQ